MKKTFYKNLSLALILTVLFSFSTQFVVMAEDTSNTKTEVSQTVIKDTVDTKSEDTSNTQTKPDAKHDTDTAVKSEVKPTVNLDSDTNGKKATTKTTAKKANSKSTSKTATTTKTKTKTTAKAKPVKKYTKTEIEMVQYVVQNEAGSMSFYHKQVITDVILNRVSSKKFPNSVKNVLSQPGQFSTWKYYLIKRNPPSKSTKKAVLTVMNGDDNGVAKGALFFYAPSITRSYSTKSWFERQTFVMQLSEKHYGITYTHRFFK